MWSAFLGLIGKKKVASARVAPPPVVQYPSKTVDQWPKDSISPEILVDLWKTDKSKFKRIATDWLEGPEKRYFINYALCHVGVKEEGNNLLEVMIEAGDVEYLKLIKHLIAYKTWDWEFIEDGSSELILNCLRWAVESNFEELAKWLVIRFSKIDKDKPVVNDNNLAMYFVRSQQVEKVLFLLKLNDSEGKPYLDSNKLLEYRKLEPIDISRRHKIFGSPWDGENGCIIDEPLEHNLEKDSEEKKASPNIR